MNVNNHHSLRYYFRWLSFQQSAQNDGMHEGDTLDTDIYLHEYPSADLDVNNQELQQANRYSDNSEKDDTQSTSSISAYDNSDGSEISNDSEKVLDSEFQQYLNTDEGMDAIQKERDRIQKKLERQAFKREKLAFAQSLLANHVSEGKDKAKRPSYWSQVVSAAWKTLYDVGYVPKNGAGPDSDPLPQPLHHHQQNLHQRRTSSLTLSEVEVGRRKEKSHQGSFSSPSSSRSDADSSLSSDDSDMEIINAPILADLPAWLTPQSHQSLLRTFSQLWQGAVSWFPSRGLNGADWQLGSLWEQLWSYTNTAALTFVMSLAGPTPPPQHKSKVYDDENLYNSEHLEEKDPSKRN